MPTVSTFVWLLAVLFIVALLVFDFVLHVQKAHTPIPRESAI